LLILTHDTDKSTYKGKGSTSCVVVKLEQPNKHFSVSSTLKGDKLTFICVWLKESCLPISIWYHIISLHDFHCNYNDKDPNSEENLVLLSIFKTLCRVAKMPVAVMLIMFLTLKNVIHYFQLPD
jgi:hypothetical protein